MLSIVFQTILLIIISFLPILIWGYIFSYIDNNSLNKKRFFIGVLGGAVSVVPILYMDKIIDIIPFEYLNIFYFASEIQGFFSSMKFAVSLSLFLGIIILLSFVLGIFIKKSKQLLSMYIKNTLVFLFCILLLSIFMYVGNILLTKIDFTVSEAIAFKQVVFNSFKLIVFYYLLVAFIEESSKHFNFLQSSGLSITSVRNGVLYSIFVALGFAFVENILYLYSLYNTVGLGSELIRVYFARAIFSVMVHILCSSVIGYYFSKALLLYRSRELSFPYLKVFLSGLFLSIFLHLVFDVALTLGFGFVMFVYFIGGYLYVTNIFYESDEEIITQ